MILVNGKFYRACKWEPGMRDPATIRTAVAPRNPQKRILLRIGERAQEVTLREDDERGGGRDERS